MGVLNESLVVSYWKVGILLYSKGIEPRKLLSTKDKYVRSDDARQGGSTPERPSLFNVRDSR